MATDTQSRDNDFVNLRIPKQHAQPVRDFMRNHLEELPSQVRNDVQSQLSGWEIGGAGGGGSQGTQQGGQRSSQR